MSQDLAEHINKYKETPLYKTFHSYHSLDDEEERLVFKQITPQNNKDKTPNEVQDSKEAEVVKNKQLDFAKSIVEQKNTDNGARTPTPLSNRDEEAMTDKTPQNQTFKNNEVKHHVITPNETNNRPVKQVKPTATPLVHRPATSGIATTPSDTSVSTPRNTTAVSYGGPETINPNTTTVNTSLPTHSESITIPTRNNNTESNSSKEAFEPSLKEKTIENERKTEVAREPLAPKKALKPNNINNEEVQNKTESKLKPKQGDKDTNNLLMDVLKKKTKPKSKPTHNSDSYEQIKKAGEDINFIEKSQRLELAFKHDLAKIPLKQLNVYSIDDQSKSFIPFNTSLFNVLGSVVVGKSMYILFIFRNGKSIAIAPENWAKNEKEMTVKTGFQFFYKDEEVDFTKLTETLKIMAGSVTPTKDYTEFWLKYMPAIDAND